MSVEPALLAEGAKRAEALARKLRQDQAELMVATAEGSAEGAALLADVAACLERIAALAGLPGPSNSKPSQAKP